MTVIVEHEDDASSDPPASAEAIADAIVEAQEEAREELEQAAAVEAAVEASQDAQQQAYSHSHPELAVDVTPLHSRLDDISSRLERMEALQLAREEPAIPEVEIVEPAPEPEAADSAESSPEKTAQHHGLRRGR